MSDQFRRMITSTQGGGRMVASDVCRLCGAGRAPVWFLAWDHEIHSCKKCGFMFAAQCATAATESYEADYFNDFIKRDNQADMHRFYGGILEELGKIAPGRRLLDVGCGAGGFLSFAGSIGWSASGMDGSKAAIQYAIETHRLNAIVADLNRCDLPLEAYDVIWSFHVMEHLMNPRHLLTKISEALVPKGIVYLGLPLYTRRRIQFHQWLYETGIAHHPYDFNLPSHVSFFNTRTLCDTLSTIGLDIIRVWFSAKLTLADLVVAASRSGGARKVLSNLMLPFRKGFGKIGTYQHFNVIAQKRHR
jgi:SAM-dependent methyltransferase